MVDLSNENVIHIKKGNIEYLHSYRMEKEGYGVNVALIGKRDI